MSSSFPPVTVVMVTRNRRDQATRSLGLLRELLDDAPIVVVDNGSTDGTAELVEREFPDVRVIRAERNLGGVGRNVGVCAAATDYVAFADDDSWWGPGALDDAAKLMAEHPRLALLAARIILQPRGDTDPVCAEMAASPLPRAEDLPGPSILGFAACGAVVRRSAFLQVGGFRSLLAFGGEEAVVALDLAAAGWGLAYVDGIVAYHHPLPHPDRCDRGRLVARNAALTAWLRRPLPVAVRRTATLLASHDPQVRQGAREALGLVPAALRQRHPLPDWLDARAQLLETSDGR